MTTYRNIGCRLETFPRDYIVLDIETTGLDPSSNKIIKISAIKYRDRKAIENFSTMIHLEEPLCSFITHLTGITNEMLTDAPLIENVMASFDQFAKDSIIVGHNVQFDLNFIYDKMEKFLDKVFCNDYLDTLFIARKILKSLNNYKLETIARHYNINYEGAHKGLVNCELINQIMYYLEYDMNYC